MELGGSNVLLFAQPEPGLPAMWGSAAWAQTQLTPGVSALAAPLQIRRLARTGREREPRRESRARALAELLAGFVSLLAGMFLLRERPLVGVLAMLGGMAFLLRSTARLCKEQVTGTDFVNRG